MLRTPDTTTPLYVHPSSFGRTESDSDAGSDVSISPTAQDLSGKNNGKEITCEHQKNYFCMTLTRLTIGEESVLLLEKMILLRKAR